MINLLPPDVKASYRYAHKNVRMLRWVIALGFGFIGLIVISTAGAIYIRQTSAAYTSQIAASKTTLQQQNQTQTETDVTNITNSLQLATQVLSKEVLFSKLLTQLATATPNNVVLTGLDINGTQGGIDISALATDYDSGTQFQVNLADPANKIFSKADIVNIACLPPTSNDPASAHYPCQVNLRALFANNNPFLFVNQNGS